MLSTLKIDENYLITNDGNNWVLQFTADPEEKVVKGVRKMVSSKDRWNYPNIKLCLKKYCQHALSPCESVEDILSKMDEIEEKIVASIDAITKSATI